MFKLCFATVIGTFSIFSTVMLTSWIGVSSVYSLMSIQRSAERKTSLNFVAESF